jgi:transposase InsO family protein
MAQRQELELKSRARPRGITNGQEKRPEHRHDCQQAYSGHVATSIAATTTAFLVATPARRRELAAWFQATAHARPRFGFTRSWVLLRREGWLVNKKRVRRLYRLEGLQFAHQGAQRTQNGCTPRLQTTVERL